MTDSGANASRTIVTFLRAKLERYDSIGIQAERCDIPRVNFGKRSGCKLLIPVILETVDAFKSMHFCFFVFGTLRIYGWTRASNSVINREIRQALYSAYVESANCS